MEKWFGVLNSPYQNLCDMWQFPWNSEKNIFDPFLRHFSLVEAKMKVKMKLYGKISSILEFTTSKLVYVPVFMKVWEKTFDPLFKTFWKKIKNEDKSEKNGKLSSIFEFSISKLGYVAVFMKICKKNGWPIF